MEQYSKIAHQLERDILSHSGLTLDKDLIIKDVEIEYPEPKNHIHTTICGQNNSKYPLVLLHGYGGSGILYYPMLSELAKGYNVFCIDLLGMGLSSRPPFNFETTEETVKYFVESTEAWRKAMSLETIYIGGHSFGGYMAAQYALKYPERVSKLFLLSPVGVSEVQQEIDIEAMKKKMGCIRRKIFSFAQNVWREKKSPQKIMAEHSWLGPWMLKRYVNNRFKISQEVKKPLYDFLMECFKLPEGSEKSLYTILKPPRARAILPLENLIRKNLKCDAYIYYGESDWMDQTGAKNLVQREKLQNLKLIKIPDCGHQITVENPQFMANELLKQISL
jgi:abhydrolase domain-containing protein 5